MDEALKHALRHVRGENANAALSAHGGPTVQAAESMQHGRYFAPETMKGSLLMELAAELPQAERFVSDVNTVYGGIQQAQNEMGTGPHNGGMYDVMHENPEAFTPAPWDPLNEYLESNYTDNRRDLARADLAAGEIMDPNQAVASAHRPTTRGTVRSLLDQFTNMSQPELNTAMGLNDARFGAVDLTPVGAALDIVDGVKQRDGAQVAGGVLDGVLSAAGGAAALKGAGPLMKAMR